MITANKKRAENIAEYILYIWELEDLLRAFSFDMELIYENLIEPQEGLTDDEKQQTYFWYMDLVALLKNEGKVESGHIDYFMHIIHDLNDLHLQLLGLPVGREYKAYYASVAPYLDALRAEMGKPDMSDIEVSFRALYSVILLRLQGKESNETYIKEVIEVISPLIARLAKMFHEVENGTVDLFKNE